MRVAFATLVLVIYQGQAGSCELTKLYEPTRPCGPLHAYMADPIRFLLIKALLHIERLAACLPNSTQPNSAE